MSKEDVLLFGCYGKRGTGKSYYEKLKEKDKEIEKLADVIEEDLREMYLTFGEFSKEFTENRIKELKGDSING